MQARWARGAEQRVPHVGAKADNARQVAGGDALADRAHQGGNVPAPRTHLFSGLLAGREGRDDEDRATCDVITDGLRFWGVFGHRIEY